MLFLVIPVLVAIITILYLYKDTILIKLFLLKHSNVRNDITIEGRIARIEFYRSGVKYTIYLPFNPQNKFKQDKIFLVKNQEKLDVTHMPGIPYFLTGEDMNGELIKETIEGDVKFDKNEIPNL